MLYLKEANREDLEQESNLCPLSVVKTDNGHLVTKYPAKCASA